MMRMDIGVDFSRNDRPPRTVHLTDWEARLIEHCLGLYVAAAVAIDDVTVPLCQGALLKVQLGVLPSRQSEKNFRARERKREKRRLQRAEMDDEMEQQS